jgi:Ger(x)C family germination protein
MGEQQGTNQEFQGQAIRSSCIAVNMDEAHTLLSTTISRYLNIDHLKVIVISEEVARSGVSDILAYFLRYPQNRSSFFLSVAKGKAEDFIINNKPKLDFLPAKWSESYRMNLDASSYSITADVHDFYLRLKNPGGSPYATYIGINPLTGEDNPAEEKLPNDKTDAYQVGDIPRTGTANAAEFVGVAVFAGDKMVGSLDTKETRVLCMLENNFPSGSFVLADPLQPQKTIDVQLRNGSKPKISVDLIDGQEVIKISVFLEGEITNIPSGIAYEHGEYLELLEKEITNLVTQEIQGFIRHTQKLGSDVFGFGYYLRPQFATYDELRKVNLEELYKTANVAVVVDTKLRRTGLMWRTTPFKPAATSR